MRTLSTNAGFVILALISLQLLASLHSINVNCTRGADKWRRPGIRKTGFRLPDPFPRHRDRHRKGHGKNTNQEPFLGFSDKYRGSINTNVQFPWPGKGSRYPHFIPGFSKQHAFHNPYFHIISRDDDYEWSREQGWHSSSSEDEYHLSEEAASETTTALPTTTALDDGTRSWKGEGSFTGDIRLACLRKNTRKNCAYGVVQMYHKELGSWGTVCGDKWTAGNAKVVCSYLNYKHGKALKLGPAKQTNGVELLPKYLRKLRCKGSEWSVTDCAGERINRNYTCRTNKLAGVKCTGHLGDQQTIDASCPMSNLKCKLGNRCIAPNYVCDGMSDCPWGSDEENCNEASCKKDQYWCGPKGGGCISNEFLCDGELDCIDGSDEKDCEKFLEAFTKSLGKKMRTRRYEVQWENTNAYMCAQKCKEEAAFVCTSFDFHRKSRMCLLYPSTAPTQLKNSKRWDHYETETKEDCGATGKYRCNDGSCVLKAKVCDFKDDCPNGEEENECEPMKVRLRGGSGPFEGHVEVAKGLKFGLVCDTRWSLSEAHVVCRNLGYGRGASKALKGGSFGRSDRNYVLDNVRCTGRETSLEDCRHDGWSNAKCGVDHEAGVICLSDETTTPFISTTPRPATPSPFTTESPTTAGQCGVKPASPIDVGPQARIVGGIGADPHEWPWQVAIWLPWTYWCGGSLIHPCWVLTAAHCFARQYPLKYYTVRLGDHVTGVDDGTEQYFQISEIIKHEYNVTTKENDIALLRISNDAGRCAQITEYVQTVCIPKWTSQFPAKTVCQVTGWGKDSASASKPYVPVLQEADVPTIADKKCSRESEYGELKRSMFCAGYLSGGIDSCQGDSGGPLSCQDPLDGHYYVWGIVSWGNGCARPKAPGVYTKVGLYTEWIEEATGMEF